jgi:serine/threonine-protein kinase
LPGTPAYIAPELVSGRDQVTAAADLFAFGVIAYEMLTARRPFVEPPALALMEGRPAETAPSIISVWPWAIGRSRRSSMPV